MSEYSIMLVWFLRIQSHHNIKKNMKAEKKLNGQEYLGSLQLAHIVSSNIQKSKI